MPAAPVLRILETQAYRNLPQHSPGFIARCLGIDRQSERDCLGKLLFSQIIDKKRQKYVVRESRSTVDTQGGRQALHNLKQHWTNVAAERLRTPRDGDLFAYNVVSVSQADLDRIREKLQSTFRDIRSLVAASKPEEAAALINLQIVTFLPDNQ